MENYQVNLFYGYEEGECGIYHAFEALDPDAKVDDGSIGARLAAQLDCSLEDDRFNYDSMYINLPETLVAKVKQDAIKEYIAGKNDVAIGSEKNTKITYHYSDASNYHAHNECIIRGVLTSKQKQLILDCLHEGEFFVPGAVGLDVELPWEYDPQDDHPFWSLDEDSFEETTRSSTVNITAKKLVRAFIESKDKWEQLGVEYTPNYEEDYASVVQDIIEDAQNRCDMNAGHSSYDIELV